MAEKATYLDPTRINKYRKIDNLRNLDYNLKHLDYLHLKIPNEKKYKKLKDNSLIRCNFNIGDHSLHGENPQLNTITDLIIILGENLQKENNKIIDSLVQIERKVDKTALIINRLEQNLDFFKQQQDSVRNQNTSIPVIEHTNISILLKEIKDIILS